MTDKPGPTSLEEIEGRLEKARKAQEEKRPKANASGKSMGIAFRISIELVLGVCVGAFVGWQIDQWLGTIPLFLLLFFLLGFAAGLRNVFRAADQMKTTVSTEPSEDEASAAEASSDEEDEEEQGNPT